MKKKKGKKGTNAINEILTDKYSEQHPKEERISWVFKLKRSGRKNRHHIRNKCYGGKNIPENILMMDINRHKAWHFLFGNMSFLEVSDLLIRCDKIKKGLKDDCKKDPL